MCVWKSCFTTFFSLLHFPLSLFFLSHPWNPEPVVDMIWVRDIFCTAKEREREPKEICFWTFSFFLTNQKRFTFFLSPFTLFFSSFDTTYLLLPPPYATIIEILIHPLLLRRRFKRSIKSKSWSFLGFSLKSSPLLLGVSFTSLLLCVSNTFLKRSKIMAKTSSIICMTIFMMAIIIMSASVTDARPGGGDDKGGSVIILGMPGGGGGYGGHGGYPNIVSGGGKKDGDTIIIGPHWWEIFLIRIKLTIKNFVFLSFDSLPPFKRCFLTPSSELSRPFPKYLLLILLYQTSFVCPKKCLNVGAKNKNCRGIV